MREKASFDLATIWGLKSLPYHQLIVLKRRTKRPRLHRSDRLFWILLRHFWPHWAKPLLIVRPETVVGWHRQGFRYTGVFAPGAKRS
jgi:hypothetical protein